ncbi:MAG TPA: hypothetical protein VHI95_14175 [Acidimicrobiales bacterium]|nr:hypothetical protein [Acidimicrobiales bacterium]
MKTPTDVERASTGEPASDDSSIGEPPSEHVQSAPSRLAKRIYWASVAITIVPLVSATVGALNRGWIPIGDNPYFELRARDVFSHHFPLLGTWTSASQSTNTNVNNPGPLFFDLLAIPVKLFNSPGLAVGVLLLNSAAIIGIAVVAYRRGGPLAGTASMAMAAGLTWTMGSELLFDPWQPHAMLLPFLFFVVLVWSLACGDLVLLPLAVAVASLVLQTHLSYAVLVPVLAIWGTVALAWTLRNRKQSDPDGWPVLRRKARRTSLFSAAVFVVLWAPPLFEEAVHGRDGNLSLLVSTIGKAKQTVGWGFGSRMVAAILSLPPWWMRPSFGDAFVPKTNGRPLPGVQPELAHVPTLVASLVSLAFAATLLGVLLWDARRRADRTASAALATALVAAGGALVTAGTLPRGFFGIAPHQFRWLWPVSLFILFAALLAIARRLPPVRATQATAVFAVGALVLALLDLPTKNQRVGPSADAGSIPATHTLLSQLGALDGSGTLLFDVKGLRFAEPYSVPVINALDRRGVEIVVDDDGMVHQLGEARDFDGHANGRLFMREADGALLDYPGARRVAIAYGLNDAEQRERDDLRAQLSDYIATNGLQLTDAGRKQPPLPDDLQSLLPGDQIGTLLHANALALDDTWRPRFERYAELQQRWDAYTVALFLAPLDTGE